MFVKINGERHYLWRAVDHKGEVLESYVTKPRDKKAALKCLKKTLTRHDHSAEFVIDRLCSYGAALKDIGIREWQETGCRRTNRAENSHQPFRRRERAMAKFKSPKSLQKFVSIHASVHNHSNQERHLRSRQILKLNLSLAFAEWRQIAA